MHPTLKSVRVFSFAVSIMLSIAGCTKSNNSQPVTPPIDTTTNPPPPAKTWMVSTVAGNGKEGNTDGPDSLASFHAPVCLALDGLGNIFVSDLLNYTIRKISNGQVTTYAGKGISAPEPSFGAFFGLIVDNNGAIYDIEYSLVRKITSSTASSVFAGSLEETYRDGQDTAARFYGISRIAKDKDGNFYLPDYDRTLNFLIRKITPGGYVSTVHLTDNTGISSGSTNSLFYTSAIAVDDAGNMYFTANGNNLIKKADPAGNVSILAGAGNIGFKDGKGREAEFYNINAITVDNTGNLYVADEANHAIRKVTPDGTVTTIAGSPTGGFKDGEGNQAAFLYPSDITIDKNGALYVADFGNNRIRKLEYK